MKQLEPAVYGVVPVLMQEQRFGQRGQARQRRVLKVQELQPIQEGPWVKGRQMALAKILQQVHHRNLAV